jgi:hypothetical protein
MIPEQMSTDGVPSVSPRPELSHSPPPDPIGDGVVLARDGGERGRERVAVGGFGFGISESLTAHASNSRSPKNLDIFGRTDQ